MTQKIRQLLKDYFRITGKVTIHPDETVDVDGDVILTIGPQIPIKFGSVSGMFYCSHLELTSLEGAPQSVGGKFSCSFNKLTSLEGAPQSVGGIFSCTHNDLKSLNGLPSRLTALNISYNRNLPLVRLVTLQIGRVIINSHTQVEAILNKYLNRPTRPERYKAAMLCAKELMDAGYEENAKL